MKGSVAETQPLLLTLTLLALLGLSGCAPPHPSATPTPTQAPTPTPARSVALRVEPFIPAGLGDRVTGPTTVYVEAPGAVRVEVYVQPVEGPFSEVALAEAQQIGVDDDPADGFAIAWSADAPYFAVKLTAVAYWPGHSAALTSNPIWILLDWRTPPPSRPLPIQPAHNPLHKLNRKGRKGLLRALCGFTVNF